MIDFPPGVHTAPTVRVFRNLSSTTGLAAFITSKA